MKNHFLNLLFIFTLLLFLQSCEENYTTLEGNSEVLFMSDLGNRVLIGSETRIRLETNRGQNVTHEAMVFINDELVSENNYLVVIRDEVDASTIEDSYLTISSNIEANFTLKAEYFNLDTTFEINFHDGTDQVFKKRVLVEDYTGTWCGWCPRVSHAMKLVSETSENVIFTAIHRAPTGTADPFNFEGAGPLENMINTPGYPKGFINRIHQWSFPEPDNISQVIDFTLGERPNLDLAVNSSINDEMLEIELDVLFTEDYSDIKLVVYLQEYGLVHPQTNYTSYFDGENPIQNYEHNYTLRKVITDDILGDEIKNEDASRGSLFSRNFAISLPENIENKNNLMLVGFIVDDNNEVINVRKAKVGENQEFEFD